METASWQALIVFLSLLTTTTCGGGEQFPADFEDCIGNEFPTCGGCLWARNRNGNDVTQRV